MQNKCSIDFFNIFKINISLKLSDNQKSSKYGANADIYWIFAVSKLHKIIEK